MDDYDYKYEIEVLSLCDGIEVLSLCEVQQYVDYAVYEYNANGCGELHARKLAYALKFYTPERCFYQFDELDKYIAVENSIMIHYR